MRDLRFRAWDKTQNHWVNINHIELRIDGVIYDPIRRQFPSDYQLMQYTGLHDKNGVEIYEGDIVKMPADLWIGKESVGKAKGTFRSDVFVEYVGGSFRLNKPGDDSDNYYGVINYSTNSKAAVLEVIGNIYTAMENMNGRIAELEGEIENNGGGE